MYDKHIYQNKDFTVRNVKSWNWYLKFLKLESSLTQHRRFRRQNPPSPVTVKYSTAPFYDHSWFKIS